MTTISDAEMITLIQISARDDPRYDLLFESLSIQEFRNLVTQIIIVDFFAQEVDDWTDSDANQRNLETRNSAAKFGFDKILEIVPPKPNVWAGPYRLTKENWWHASAARNTGICLARNEWLVFVDDRAALDAQWSIAVEAAMQGMYVACGTYEKVHNLVLEKGRIKSYTDIGCRESRIDAPKMNPGYHGTENPFKAPGEWTYGCSLCLPLVWALHVNGFDETADSLSGEDTAFGLMLANNGLPIKFDLRMKVIQDRTPGQLGPCMKRTDKGISPADKSHAYVDNIRKLYSASHWWRMWEVRDGVLSGQPFPIPTGPRHDWWDGQPIEEM